MTAATTTTAPRPTLEELVDRLIDAIFGGDGPTSTSAPNLAGEGPSMRRGGFARRASSTERWACSPTWTAPRRPTARRWAYAEFLDLARRRFRDEDALVYSPSRGRAAVLTPCDDGALEVRAVLGMRWPLGKLVSRRSLRGLTTPRLRRRVMSVAQRQRRHPRAQSPPPAGRRGRGVGAQAPRSGPRPPGRLSLPRGDRGQLHRLRRHAAVLLLRLRPGRRRAGLHPAHRRRRPARGDPPAQRR